MNRLFLPLLLFLFYSCSQPFSVKNTVSAPIPGDYSILKYANLLKNKRVALLVNHSACLNQTSLLDTLLRHSVTVKKIFVPEHGFRGTEEAGENIADSRDHLTNLPIISLFGKKIKPSIDDLKDIDILVYDIQDVGVRFYTYISTLFYAMEAVSESGIQLLLLDRPNPNGDYVDGPVLDLKYKSFVGVLPIPVVYGMTSGELALMINGEGWLPKKAKCNLTVIKCRNYTHQSRYELPIAPSPNLQTYQSLRLYPSLCLFEATRISVGRGTLWPFMVVGGLDSCFGAFKFKPQKNAKGTVPVLNAGVDCYGLDLRRDSIRGFNLKYLFYFYSMSKNKNTFFTNKHWFDLLAGNDKLRVGLVDGLSEEQIRASWESDLDRFKTIRKKYLIYDDYPQITKKAPK